MRPLRPLLGGLACLALFAAVARADAPPDPLRLVPDQADFFVEIKQPAQLVEAGTSTDLFKTALALPPVREYYDSTSARRCLSSCSATSRRSWARSGPNCSTSSPAAASSSPASSATTRSPCSSSSRGPTPT